MSLKNIKSILEPHPAEIYRNRRAKYFAIAQRHGFDTAYYILDKDRDDESINPKDYAGLLSELIFLECKNSELDLSPTLDCGDHCDFRGHYQNVEARFDVTSSLTFKDLDTYEPFQREGKNYFIALIDPKKRKLDRIIDINIPFCPKCGGRLINTVIIGNVDYTAHGTPTQTETIIKVCSKDISHNVDFATYEYFIPLMEDEEECLAEIFRNDKEQLSKEVKLLPIKHGIDNSVFFSKKCNEKIHACGKDVFTPSGYDGSGYPQTIIYWKSDLIDTVLPSEFGDVL